MSGQRRISAMERLVNFDRVILLTLNRSLLRRGVQPFFAVISNLGNGKFWYALMIFLAVGFGMQGVYAALHMGLVGLFTLIVYKMIKGKTQRPRPCQVNSAVILGTQPLDEFSFPSGHTMHAVAFSIIAAHWFPWLMPVLIAFTVLVAISRVVLGLHYPTDVILGATLGAILAKLSFIFTS